MTSGYFPGGYGSPYDDLFARYMGGANQPRQKIDIGGLLSQPARELVNRGPPGGRARQPRPGHRAPAVGRVDRREPTAGAVSRAGADPDTLLNGLGERRGDGGPRHRGGRPEPLDPGGQAGAAGRAPDLPRARLHLHRPRAHPVRAGRQPRVRRGPDPAGAPGSPPRRCSAALSGQAPAAARRSGRPGGRSATPTAGRVRPRPDRAGPGGPDRPGDRPRRRDRADRRGPVPPDARTTRC